MNPLGTTTTTTTPITILGPYLYINSAVPFNISKTGHMGRPKPDTMYHDCHLEVSSVKTMVHNVGFWA